MPNRFYVLLGVLFILGCQPKEQLPIVQKINSNWFFKSKNTTDWRSATVPGNVFTDLLDHNLIEDPFIKTNEEKVQWVSDSSWVYKTTFNVDKKTLQKKHIELNFEGLDTYAKVYLNDRLILSFKNAFRKYVVPVKSILKRENELRVQFESTSITEESEKKKLGYELPEGHRIFTRKAQFQYGWDWGPKLNTSGIWKEISLKAWDDTLIKEVYLQQTNYSEEKAEFFADIKIESSLKKSAKIQIEINDTIYKKEIGLQGKTFDYAIPIKIKNPKFWWPHNLGEPYLYDVYIKLVVDGKIVDKKRLKHGIRDIELMAEKDSIGESFYFKINNVPVYAKGANYIPQNSFQNKVTDAHYEKLLSDVVDANMNMLRVWGGGIYENDIFYDLCDEKGILVWQDFMFACAMYPGDTNFLENVKEEATQQVKRLRNHASVALWAGNNENSEGWHRWGWQSGRSEAEKNEIWRNYLKVFDSILPNTVKNFSQTPYWESSPKYGRGNTLYKTEGDAHDWWVWHDGYPFEHFEKNVPRFMSEFGFQSFPSFETLNYINQEDSVNIHMDAIQSHQKHSRGFQLIREYMERDYPVPTKDEDYVYMSQLVQARGITKGIEAHRRAKPYNMGTLYWQLNDCWPAISWSSIDYFGNWKALHYKAKKSFDNLLISSHRKDNVVSTHIINDSLESYSDTLSIRIIDFEGRSLWLYKEHITIDSNVSKKVFELSLDSLQFNKSNAVMKTSFKKKYSNFYFSAPKHLALPISAFSTNILKTRDGFNISIFGFNLLKDVFIIPNVEGTLSDNFFDVLPGERKTVFFRTNVDSLTTKNLRIKHLNAFGFGKK
ncbi:glycoside hydrolase family 2 protein [Flavobacteriaceae bacterium S356]|uniref:Beta-mannosidase B n=1 Tax=Asprobacillus argus TaxID=3076534 RepID=A0ABU3LHF6_9FLAO|nr:glycoside hydrolase family 2 protein [Flavobacteriaceae bacterium S356]